MKAKEIESMCSNMKEFQTVSETSVAGLSVLFTAYVNPRFDKDAFIAGEEDGEATYQKYLKNIPMEKITVRLAKTQL